MTDEIEPLSDEALESTRAFAALAQSYCELIQNHTSLNLIAFARECARQLALLYAAALKLPDVDTCELNNERSEGADLGQTWHMLDYKLGSYSFYRQVFNPYEH